MSQSLPLRTPEDRLDFCENYFRAVDTPCSYESPMYREYTLPRDVDKELTDRPFYWMWIEKTNQEHKPTILRLAFTQEAMERENQRLKDEAMREAQSRNLSELERMFFRPPTCELVSLGSFRLDKLYESVDSRGAFASVGPKHKPPQATVVPWLLINALISYRCDLVEQEFVSIGVCLVNGQVVERFFEMVHRIEMESKSPKDILSTAALSIDQGLEKADRYLTGRLQRRPTEWAIEAESRLDKEIRQIQTYYRSIMPDVKEEERGLVEAEQHRKERDLIEKSQPHIDIEYCQMALVALMER